MKLKILVLILGIIGSLGSVGLGIKWMSDYNKYGKQIEATKKIAKSKKVNKHLHKGFGVALDKLETYHTASYLLLIGGIISLVASGLIFKLGRVSGIVLLLAFIIPVVLAPESAILTFLLPVAGILALLIKKPQASLVEKAV